MRNSVLYPNLIAATANIIKKFGTGIIYEERFVNVLSDLSPGKNEPAVFKIIRSALQDDLLKPVLIANAKNIEHQVATASTALTKQYGYDQSLVEGILFSLAIGYGTITDTQYNALKAQKNKPSKKQLPPSQNTKPNTNKPSNGKQHPNKNNANGDFIPLQQIAFLSLAILGVLVSPIVYAGSLCSIKNVPLGATIFVALIQFLTTFPISVVLATYIQDTQKKISPTLLGGYVALHIIAIGFWAFFPFFFGFEDVHYYFGYKPNKDGFPVGAVFLNAFCAFFLYARIDETFRLISSSTNKTKIKLSEQLASYFKLSPFKKGFRIVSMIFLCCGLFMIIYPLLPNVTRSKVEAFDLRNEAINKKKDKLREERSKNERDLSFAQYHLGDSYSSCIDKIPETDEFSTDSKSLLTIDGIDYFSMTDSVVKIKSQWNNENVEIELYFNNSNLFAISFEPHNTRADSIVSIYTEKYGEPEYHLLTYYEMYGHSNDKKTFYRNMAGRDYLVTPTYKSFNPSDYFWTFKNSLINIHTNTGYYAEITYLDRRIEHIQKEKIKEQERLRLEAEKRQNDSIQKAQEEAERIELERQRREELERERNHQRSIEQI